MASSGRAIQRYPAASTALAASPGGSSLLLELVGVAPLARGLTALEQARSYEAQVELQVAIEQSRVIASKARSQRYEELTKHLKKLEAIVLSLQKAYTEAPDRATRDRNRELLQLAVDALERATLVDR